MFENIPRPVLYGGGALLLIVAFLFSRRGGATEGAGGTIGPTLASMQLAASTNIQALEITSRRDVALASEHTKRYQAAYGINAMREANALNFVTEKMVGRNTIELAHLEAASIQREMDQHYALANLREQNAQVSAARMFGLAKTQQAQDFQLASKYFELDKLLGIGYLDLDKISLKQNYELQKVQQEFDFLANRRAMRFGYPIMMRRYDLQEHQANLGAGASFMGQIPGLVDAGLSIYDKFAGQGPQVQGAQGGGTGLGTAGNVAAGALSGAASGAALGTTVFPGVGTAIGAGIGAAAGGGGGAS